MPILAVVCNTKTRAGTKIAGAIFIIGANQFAKAVTLPKPIVFPAVKNFLCSLS